MSFLPVHLRMQTNRFNVDIFCDVVDNFGDAGVCWRLARSLFKEKGLTVRLYINDFETLSKIVKAFDKTKDGSVCEGITVCRWEDALNNEPAEVVIETFGCRLDERFEEKIAATKPAPIWINLEYLSAEDWVEGCHSLPSPHPRLNANKYFFFPGLTKKTGSVVIEEDLLQRQKDFESHKADFLKKLGVVNEKALKIFVFCYPTAPLKELVNALKAADDYQFEFLLASGEAGEIIQKSVLDEKLKNVHCVKLPLVDQKGFDSFLWASDLLIVRGEDSFVRAQLAAKPFIWNIYPQDEKAHIVKLEAFLNRQKPFLKSDFETIRKVNLDFNDDPKDLTESFLLWLKNYKNISSEMLEWRNNLILNHSLTENLCKFIQEKLKSTV